ncbi:MAG: hypothetical protein DI565_13075 [Ancylobacter novellus]|uniref:Uncharacterized protein n=1 Tax=Ancylobacter novellus TaxID=921 RepID=A0A2W5KF14_ANCNO|nr:MAG: hypothetical protein DI565_13075 [Ancylobacter novellus]
MTDPYASRRTPGGRIVTVNRAESFDLDGRPRRPVNDRLVANSMRHMGCSTEQVVHVLGYLPDLTLPYGDPHPGRIRFDRWGYHLSDTHAAAPGW